MSKSVLPEKSSSFLAGLSDRLALPATDTAAAWVLAAAIIVVSAALMPLLSSLAGAALPPYITFYPAVVLAALAGGSRVGLATAAATLVIAWWFFVPAYGSFNVSGAGTSVIVLIYALTSAFLGWIVGQARLALDAAVASEARRHHAARESVHRIKNLLAVVQAIIAKVAREVDTTERYRTVLSERMAALGIAQDVLVRRDWQDASLESVVDAALAPFLPNPGLRVRRGPEATVPAHHVSGLCMALYELCTNAMKYGALVDGRGPVLLSWQVDGGRVVLEWDEKTATDPRRAESFGSRLVRAALSEEAATRVDYRIDEDGIYARFQWPAAGSGNGSMTSASGRSGPRPRNRRRWEAAA